MFYGKMIMIRISSLALLGSVACGQEESGAGAAGGGQTKSELRAVYETAIHVNDPAGRARTGVAMTTRPFAGPADSYFGSAQVILGSGSIETARPRYSTRLEDSRRSLKENSFTEPNPLAIAYVFEDDDVIGLTGPSLTESAFALAPDPGKPGDVTEVKGALTAGFVSQEFVFFSGDTNPQATPWLQCFGSYPLGYRTEGSWSFQTVVQYQYKLGNVSADETTSVDSWNRYYNIGNWWTDHGFGFYRVNFRNVGGFATIESNLGCLF
jgi:hypothetical protein